MIYSFFVPWVYHLFRDINDGFFIRYFPMAEVMVSDTFYYLFVICPLLIEIIIIFLRIYMNPKIRNFTSVALIELLILIPGIMIPFNVSLGRCHSFIPEEICIRFGYFYGLYLYILGISVLAINGLQISIYSKFIRKSL